MRPGKPFPYAYAISKVNWVELNNCLIGETA